MCIQQCDKLRSHCEKSVFMLLVVSEVDICCMKTVYICIGNLIPGCKQKIFIYICSGTVGCVPPCMLIMVAWPNITEVRTKG